MQKGEDGQPGSERRRTGKREQPRQLDATFLASQALGRACAGHEVELAMLKLWRQRETGAIRGSTDALCRNRIRQSVKVALESHRVVY